MNVYDSNLFEIQDDLLIKYNGDERSVRIPEGVRQIGPNAFQDNYFIEEIFFPFGLNKIGDYAFDGCKRLSKITFAGNLKVFPKCSPPLYVVGSFSFRECEMLEEIILYTVGIIGESAFEGCFSLKK